MDNGNIIVGRTKNTDVYDFYETPKWATEKAVEKMLIDGVINKYDKILEPCCGAGAISDVLSCIWAGVLSSNLSFNDKTVMSAKSQDFKILGAVLGIGIPSQNAPYNKYELFIIHLPL